MLFRKTFKNLTFIETENSAGLKGKGMDKLCLLQFSRNLIGEML